MMNKTFLSVLVTVLLPALSSGCSLTIGWKELEKCRNADGNHELNVIIKQAMMDGMGYVEDFGLDALADGGHRPAVFLSNRGDERKKCPLKERLAAGKTCEGLDENIDFTGTGITSYNRGWRRLADNVCQQADHDEFAACQHLGINDKKTPFCVSYCYTCDDTARDAQTVCDFVQGVVDDYTKTSATCLTSAPRVECTIV